MRLVTCTPLMAELGLLLANLSRCLTKVLNAQNLFNIGERYLTDVKDSCMFYDDLAVYERVGGIVLAKEEGQHIADALGPRKKNAILQNHG